MNVPTEEQETIINFRRIDNDAQIYTTDRTVMTKLHHLNDRHPENWKLKKTDTVNGEPVAETWAVPKRLISFRAAKTSRVITDDQKKAAAERLRNMRMSRRSDGSDGKAAGSVPISGIG